MERAPSRVEGDQPRADESLRAINCPIPVLQELRASVLERFNATPHGGAEVTGVLFGTRTGEEVRITAFFACGAETEPGPSEATMETERAITAMIAAARERKELADVEPVGWFRAHPRCQLGLAEGDLEIANRLFPQAWQVVLVMRPGNSAATRVCFYYRDQEVPWTADCPVREFTLPAGELQPAAAFAEETGGRMGTALVPAELPPVMAPMMTPPFLAPPERRGRPRVLTVALGIIGIAGLGGLYYYWSLRPQPLGLNVRATDSAAQIRIGWDRTSGAVRNARAAYLEIADGGQSERVDLDAGQLQIGYVNYPRRSRDVRIRLVVLAEGGAPAEEVAQYSGPPGEPPPSGAGANPVASESASAPEPTPEIDVPVPVETAERAGPAREQPKFQPPAERPAHSAPVEIPAPEVAPPQAGRGAPNPLLAPPVAQTAPPPEKPAPAPRTVLTNSTAAAPPAQAQTQARGAATPRVAAPSAGRIIWIGRLQKNQPLAITGKTCTTGTLVGELPARPFKFSVSPGDLTADGIVLYTSNLQYANSVVEPPGAQNGWNKTVYTWNPKFANDVTVDDGPGAQNGWNRMVLHSRNPKISVIVIDWAAVN